MSPVKFFITWECQQYHIECPQCYHNFIYIHWMVLIFIIFKNNLVGLCAWQMAWQIVFREISFSFSKLLTSKRKGRLWKCAEEEGAPGCAGIASRNFSTFLCSAPHFHHIGLFQEFKSPTRGMHRTGYYSKMSWTFVIEEINLENKLFYIRMSNWGKISFSTFPALTRQLSSVFSRSWMISDF